MISPVYVLQSATPGTPPYPITSDDLRLGRAPDCGIVLSDDAVSWHHATLREANGEVVITDENSTNGVFVDERKIQAGVPYPIRSGQTLRIGAIQFSLALIAPSMIAPPIETYEPTTAKSSPWPWLLGGVIVVALAFVLVFILMNKTPTSATPPPTLTPTATQTPHPTSTLTPVPIVTATPTQLVSPALAVSPTANSVQSIAAEMEAARTVLNQYGGKIDQAGSNGANLDCAAIVASYDQTQAARGHKLSPSPQQQDQVNRYFQSLDAFLLKARDLTDACHSALSGSNSSTSITKQQIGSARTAVIDAVGALDQIIPQIKSLP